MAEVPGLVGHPSRGFGWAQGVVKPDVKRLRAAQQALIDDAARATPAGCA
ncbi:hypothetical protein [Streptomyces sp. NPDC058086]